MSLPPHGKRLAFPPPTIARWLRGETVPTFDLHAELDDWALQTSWITTKDQTRAPDALAGFLFTLQPHESMTVEQYGEFIRYVEQMRQENAGALLSFTVLPRRPFS